MVALASLLLPILLSAVVVFIASSLIHMVLGYHANDWKKLPDEDEVMAALRRFNIPQGDYATPKPDSRGGMSDPAYLAKYEQGPVMVMTKLPGGKLSMGKNLAMWFAYSLVVGLLSAYVAGLVLPPGADYRVVFRVVSTVAFAGYALALAQNSVWYGRGWGQTLKGMFDGLIYALLTGGVFGWLWPGV